MYRNKLILTALSSVILLGAAAGASFAAGDRQHRPHRPAQHGMMGRPGMEAFREVAYVRMLKQFDANKDGQVSKQEATDGMDKIFAAIDTNSDGSLTPGEIRAYREAQMKNRKGDDADMGGAKMGAGDNNAPDASKSADNDHKKGHPQRGEGRRMGHGGGMMMAATMMRRIDTDENGQISKQEATAAFDKFFTMMDRNKDGVISIDDMPDHPFL